MPDTRMNVLAPLSSPNWSPTSESYGMPWDDAIELLDNYAVEVARAERAATYRAAADLAANNVTCSCSTCQARKDIAAVLRAKADEIDPPTA